MSTLFTQDSGNEFAVYTKTWAAVLLHGFLILGFMGFGIGFMMLYEKFVAFAIFGAFFTLVALFMLATIPKLSRRVAQENGFLKWAVSTRGMKVSRDTLKVAPEFSWADVERIVLAEKWHDVRSDEKTYSWRIVLIFLNPAPYTRLSAFGLARAARAKSPDGTIYVASSYPSHEQQTVLEGIKRFAPSHITVCAADKVIFNWKEKQVRLLNAEGRPIQN